MAIQQLLLYLRQYSAPLLFITFVAYFLHNKYSHDINHIIGPSFAALSDLWRLIVVWRRRPELEHIKLHQKYGPVVRLGPKTVSVADPEAVKVIYALNAGFSDIYPVQQTVAKGHALRSMFNTTDELFHAKLRRHVSNAYAMSTLVNFEPLVDSTTTAFLKQLKDRYATPKQICDFGTWLQWYAFDVIGELTYSKRLGFVDRGTDVDNIISNLEWLLDYVSVIGQIPILDRFFLKNPLRLLLSKWSLINSNTSVVNFARARMSDRSTSTAPPDPKRRDFLSRFLSAHEKDPDFIPQDRVLALTVANMFAGSDTTAITLRAIFYYLLKNPACMSRLLSELATLPAPDEGSPPLVSWSQARDLLYLSAVIKEALRMHPAVGLTLERVVPAQGVTVAGTFLPGGTIVGCSAWVLHRDERVFGEDAGMFRPERWLDEKRGKEMEGYLFSFGAGARTCIGKNISLLEMYKLVPAVLRAFEIELAESEKEWTLHNAWFVKQSDFNVRLRVREKPL
ncbi:cytochrome P450 monooxygenase-like protein 25 [Elsinoe australis]|uniref:Cytochrome P450 monooxygenase-like protein 25 n=1 Tax=Elsinoe australis TaxID=40998 RepID=A0A4U7AX87_9PEZI|nr:cytochrome P450 monooxygenase-like protein 25 [Elsinoe australis]